MRYGSVRFSFVQGFIEQCIVHYERILQIQNTIYNGEVKKQRYIRTCDNHILLVYSCGMIFHPIGGGLISKAL